jgi:DNA-binding LacI/PurR family transcriptional regulator
LGRFKIRDGFSAYGEYDAQVAEVIAKKLFAEKAFPDAILVIDDQMVPAIYHAARQKGLTIG